MAFYLVAKEIGYSSLRYCAQRNGSDPTTYETLEEAQANFQRDRENICKTWEKLHNPETIWTIVEEKEIGKLERSAEYSLQPLALPSPTYTTASELDDEIPL